MEAVKQDSEALESTSQVLKKNRHLVKAATKRDVVSLQINSYELHNEIKVTDLRVFSNRRDSFVPLKDERFQHYLVNSF